METPTGQAKVPRISIMFGNSMNGVFDDARARKLASRLFEVYGLSPASDVQFASDGVQATLDGLDLQKRVGFELRGRLPTGEPIGPRRWSEPEPESLDDGEARRMATEGVKLHVADYGDYHLVDYDQFTPTLAYLAGIVEFLNETTDGPDIDLTAVLAPAQQRFPLPEDAFESGPCISAVVHEGDSVHLHVTEGARLDFELSGPGCLEYSTRVRPRSWGRRDWGLLLRPRSTAGRPTMLWIDTHSRGLRLRVTQGVGERRLDVASDGPFVFLPSTFDAAEPFHLTLEATKTGKLHLDRYVKVGLVPR